MVFKLKIMETFLENKHTLLNSYSNEFAPRSCPVIKPQLAQLGSMKVVALIQGRLSCLCHWANGQAASRLWLPWDRVSRRTCQVLSLVGCRKESSA